MAWHVIQTYVVILTIYGEEHWRFTGYRVKYTVLYDSHVCLALSTTLTHKHTHLSPIYTYLQVACCCVCRLSTLRLKHFKHFFFSPALWEKRWDGLTKDKRTKKRDVSLRCRWKFMWMLYYTQNKQNMYWTSRCGGSRSRYSTRNRRTFPWNILCVYFRYMMQCNDVRKGCDILYTIYYIRGWMRRKDDYLS